MAKRLTRSKKERRIAGVCGGLAEYFDVDPVLVRVLTVLLAFISMGGAVVAYILLWIIVPEN